MCAASFVIATEGSTELSGERSELRDGASKSLASAASYVSVVSNVWDERSEQCEALSAYLSMPEARLLFVSLGFWWRKSRCPCAAPWFISILRDNLTSSGCSHSTDRIARWFTMINNEHGLSSFCCQKLAKSFCHFFDRTYRWTCSVPDLESGESLLLIPFLPKW